MNYNNILSLDPSGSFNEGKGTTGWNVFHAPENAVTIAGAIDAKNYGSMEAYWHRHIELIDIYHKRYGPKMIVVIEDYILYESKATSQINSRMETCKLIGVLQHYCWANDIPYKMQLAGEVKPRWTNEILQHKRYIIIKGKGYALPNHEKTPLNKHALDSIRHGVHFATFKNGR